MTARTDTQRIPALRLLPPAAPDRRDNLRLTRRGRIVRTAVEGVAAVAFVYVSMVGANILAAVIR